MQPRRVVHFRLGSDEKVDWIDMPHRRLRGFDVYWVSHDEVRYGGWHRGTPSRPQAWYDTGLGDSEDPAPPGTLDEVIALGNVSVYEGP